MRVRGKCVRSLVNLINGPYVLLIPLFFDHMGEQTQTTIRGVHSNHWSDKVQMHTGVSHLQGSRMLGRFGISRCCVLSGLAQNSRIYARILYKEHLLPV
ncbi:hypothetical protein VN97_g9812 [Penicillium thymicola]|uniref:Uncharacterized protein n=1 Tax=Penicillium thymicola TaxID=293382 RepID=A0AAI9X4C8_PENTH|nr:hypothetical protein VN97_g9812 [Penicillium thymicola]